MAKCYCDPIQIGPACSSEDCICRPPRQAPPSVPHALPRNRVADEWIARCDAAESVIRRITVAALMLGIACSVLWMHLRDVTRERDALLAVAEARMARDAKLGAARAANPGHPCSPEQDGRCAEGLPGSPFVLVDGDDVLASYCVDRERGLVAQCLNQHIKPRPPPPPPAPTSVLFSDEQVIIYDVPTGVP